MGARLAPLRASSLLFAAALLALAARGVAVDEVLPDFPPVPRVLIEPPVDIEQRAPLSQDGTGARELPPLKPPFAAAKAGAWWVRWDDYRTLIVVEESAGLLRPAWVVTLVAVNGQGGAQGQVAVAYRAQAYRDKDGTLHVDAHHAVMTGTMAPRWSPDSFALGADKQVATHDDDPSHDSNAGVVEKEIPGGEHAEEYRTLLRGAQSIIEDNL
ncbi:MAG: hypothetical protein H0X38_12635 [Planctomycetes bacterium]|nr:hypothetical protein [Planctomycetota bacterium]